MLIGYIENEAKNWRYVRRICWTMVKMMGDPKKVPSSELSFWHILGDPEIPKLKPEDVKRIVDKFRSTEWTLNSRLKSVRK